VGAAGDDDHVQRRRHRRNAAAHEGSSVIVTGHARRVDDPSELEQLAQRGIEPWAGGSRDAIIRVETAEISGRRIRQKG